VVARPAATWATVDAERLLPEHVEALLAQEIGFVRIPGLLSADWCAEISRRFLAFMEEHPAHHVFLRTNYVDTVVLGMNCFMRPDTEDGPSPLDEYFARVERDRPKLREIYAGGTDPYEVIAAFWRETGWSELAASENGRPYHTDVLWGMTEPAYAPAHVDTYHRETPCSLSHFPSRISCNTFVQAPLAGGDFRVHRQRQYGDEFDATAGSPFAQYAITPGDLIVFDAGHYHEVLPVEGDRHRLFSHMAVVLDPATREYSIIA
jgi:hypothetical protein